MTTAPDPLYWDALPRDARARLSPNACFLLGEIENMRRRCGLTRFPASTEELEQATGLSEWKIARALREMKSQGGWIHCEMDRGRRFITVLYKLRGLDDAPKFGDEVSAQAPGGVGAGARRCRRRRPEVSAQARYPLLEERGRGELSEQLRAEEEPSRPLTPSLSPPPAPATPAADGTGRDGDSGQGREPRDVGPEGEAAPIGTGDVPIADPTPERFAEAIAECEAAIRVQRPGSRFAKELEEKLELLKKGDATALADAQGKAAPTFAPVPPACYAGPKLKNFDADGNPRPTITRDEAYPLASILKIVESLDDPGWALARVDDLAEALCYRWRDLDARGRPNPETVETCRDAALNLGGLLLGTMIRENDGPKVDNPARRFSVVASNALKAHRKRQRRTG